MWRAAYSQDESFVKEGILQYFFDIVDYFDTDQVLLFWDSGKSEWRSKLYPEYKAQREDRKNEFDLHMIHEGKKEAQRILEFFGVRQISARGVEADDFIAWFSELFTINEGYDRVIIASRDKDLWQLANGKVVVYDPLGRELYDEDRILSEMGVPPSRVADLKALMGDVSDNIKGVKGIGEKIAKKLINEFGSVEGLLSPDNIKALSRTKTSAKILDQSDSMELSYKLVKLPSMFEMGVILSDNQMAEFNKCMSDLVEKDHMKANIYVDLLDNAYKIKQRFVDSMDFLRTFKAERMTPVFDSLRSIDEYILTCAACEISCVSKDKVFPKGYQNATYMFIGPSTLVESDLYSEFLEELEIPEDKVWATSVCKCRSQAVLEYGSLQKCLPLLRAELAFIQPKMVVVFGADALTAITEYSSSLSKHIGVIFEGSEGLVGKVDSYVAVMPDPMYILRNPGKKADWEYGAKKIKEFIDAKRSNA